MELTKVHLKKKWHTHHSHHHSHHQQEQQNKETHRTQKDKANNTVCFVNAAVANENEVGLRKCSF